MAKVNNLRLLFALLAFSSFALTVSSDDCVYTVYVRTSTILKGGTDSIISLELSDTSGGTVSIPNLESWGGLMESGHNYFERGNLDIFSGRGACLSATPCGMNLTSDGSGSHHGWFCNYVEVTITGVHMGCAQQLFTVDQWLARDAYPYELTAIRDSCDYTIRGAKANSARRFSSASSEGSIRSVV
ncbi:hypothetical protein AMTRI_Chr04g251430 [Amborella trichopoda]|uniref:PLAT domain-containing protein n=1 Tax=Amborella trichopoda TaxID=13333 RepID=W1NFD5_AMBTC|nr:PLAT domain-containing protein 3 [Amborella trichopoda]ERM94176.1 hypothetical protein AMTR_s00010p00180790 [Amborella trichopoda]|eukprot:XP_006826939.1 PLAT domain-containing protein 3 [Amborella trichopoda]